MTDFKHKEITEKIFAAPFGMKGAPGNIAQALHRFRDCKLEIGLLLNFGSKRLEFHRFTNKKFNPQIIRHPENLIHPINHSSDK